MYVFHSNLIFVILLILNHIFHYVFRYESFVWCITIPSEQLLIGITFQKWSKMTSSVSNKLFNWFNDNTLYSPVTKTTQKLSTRHAFFCCRPFLLHPQTKGKFSEGIAHALKLLLKINIRSSLASSTVSLPRRIISIISPFRWNPILSGRLCFPINLQ